MSNVIKLNTRKPKTTPLVNPQELTSIIFNPGQGQAVTQLRNYILVGDNSTEEIAVAQCTTKEIIDAMGKLYDLLVPHLYQVCVAERRDLDKALNALCQDMRANLAYE